MRAIYALLVSLSASLPAQDILHYKFDSMCSDQAINFAASTLRNGTIISTIPGAPAASWILGVWGGALNGSDKSGGGGKNFVDTGWNTTGFTGSFSISCWIRNRPGNPTALAFGYLWGAEGGSFRCFTGSSGKLFLSGWGGSLTSTTDVTSLVNAGWTHVAAVVDTAAMTGTWYINGTAETPVPFTSGPSFTATNFFVGNRDATSTSTSPFDCDEFLLSAKALSPAEVAKLASSPLGGHGVYGQGNGPSLLSAGTRPTVGGASHALVIAAPSSIAAFLVAGSNRCTLSGGIPLPYDLGNVLPSLAGTLTHTSMDLATATVPLVSGQATVPVPIPNINSLLGTTTFWQAFGLTPTASLLGSSGLAIAIGH